ncbi:MAG: hypothetical protein LBS91_02350 [Clostridiales Family XIII bacterium]|jgi:phage protein D|nr:hypothetical protein [Clostridiales Family XIII bacterium]
MPIMPSVPSIPSAPATPGGIPGASSQPGAGVSGLTYRGFYDKYREFENAEATIELNGKVFGQKQKEAFVADISVDLSCGFEASIARFRIYNAYDRMNMNYTFESVKNQAILGVSVKILLGWSGALEPVFTGFVASVDFAFDPDEPPYIEITGMDAKGVMMASAYAAQLTARSYGAAVREILQRVAYEKMKVAEIIGGLYVSDTPDSKPARAGASAETIEMVSESDYEFIVKAAKKFNYEFFVDRGAVVFRKARSIATPLATLSAQDGMISWHVNYSLTGMVEKIEVRSMNPGTGKIISAKGTYKETLSTAGKAKALVRGSRRVYIDPTVFSQEQATARLDSLMTQMSYRLGSLECECIGIPDLVPGRFVQVNVGSPGDNAFYITNVVHNFPSTGEYHTKLVGEASSVKAGGLAAAGALPGGIGI